jgi:uncharacterized protein
MNRRILISGASGPIGKALLPVLTSSGDKIVRLVRHAAKDSSEISWDPAIPLLPESVSGFDAIIHLAGETIFGRWTEAKKKKIRESRVLGTSNLAQAASRAQQKPRIFLSASAIGYYGDRGDEPLTEQSSIGTGFAAELCREWESATDAAAQAGIRTVRMRIGIIMSPDGGALQAMLPAFRMGLGGRMGDGRQWMSWIHVQDMATAVQHILENEELHGPVNMVAPDPVTNAEFARTLASVLSRPAIFPMPAFVVKVIFGQMGNELLLASQRVEPAKLAGSGYRFRYRELKPALEAILRH